MNYAIVVILGFAGFASLGYRIWGVGSFEGPQIDHDYFELQDLVRKDFSVDDSYVQGIDDQDDDDNAIAGSSDVQTDLDKPNEGP